jgi:Glycosyl transferase family 2
VSDTWEWALDSPVPEEIHTGHGSALLLHGWLFCRTSELAGLTARVGGVRRPVAAFGLPRLDVYVARARPGDTPPDAALRCAFWVVVPLPGVTEPVSAEIALEAVAADGSTHECVLAHTTVRPGRRTEPVSVPPGRAPEIAIAMATHNPDPDGFGRQIRSLQAQTVEDWVCVVSDDRSRPDAYEAMLAVLGDDERFIVSRSPVREGFYWNFGRAMELVPAGVRHVALCDQDDEWRPDKLARLRERMTPGVTLAFSDQRIVTDDGRVIADSYWGTRRNNWTDLGALLSTNTVTGAAALFRRDLLDVILPLPPRVVQAYHDHWVALCALGTGRMAFVDEPLYDYVQHAGQVVGHMDRPPESRPDGVRTEDGLRPRPGAWRTRWESEYFESGLPRQFLATALRARGHGRLTRGAARAVGRGARGDVGSRGLALTVARAGRELMRPDVTIGDDRRALRGALWRRFAGRRGRGHVPYDDPSGTVQHTTGLQELPRLPVDPADHPRVAPRLLEVDPGAPRRVNLVVTGDGPFGPALAAALERAGRPVRLVPLGGGRLDVSPEDDWIATDRDTARAANAGAERLGRRGFLYVIDGLTPPDRSTYTVRHAALFSTELLRDWFAAQALGVFGPDRPGAGAAAVFRPAVARSGPPTADRLRHRRERRLLLHTRPETPGAPTLPELAERVLRDLVAAGTLDGWELYAVMAGDAPRELDLGSGRTLELLAPAGPEGDGALFRSFDVALAPVDAPPPGRTPLELAAAGVVTVTTTFGPKDDGALRAISGNLRGAAPDREALCAALGRAVTEDVGRAEERVAGATFDWTSRWEDVFDAPLAARILALLDAVH